MDTKPSFSVTRSKKKILQAIKRDLVMACHTPQRFSKHPKC